VMGSIEPCRTYRRTKDGRTVAVWLTASALESEVGIVYAISTTERPIGPKEGA
jgi:hypothetical protein